MDDESFSDEIVITEPDSVASGSKHATLEDLLLSLSSGQRNRVVRYLNNIHSNFQVLVDEAGMLFALLFAPATGGASLALTVGAVGTTAALGGMAADGLKQRSSHKKGNNIVEVVEKLRKKAESAHKEIKVNSELLRNLLYELDPSLRSLDEDDVYQLSIGFACTRLFRSGSLKLQPRHLSIPASVALKPLQGLNVLSKGTTTTVTSVNALLRSVTTATIKEGSVVRSVGTVAVRNPVISNAGFTAIKRCSTTAVNQGTKILKSTIAVNKVGVAVIDAGDVTISKVSQLKAFITTTTKEFAPVLSKVGLTLTVVGVIFDVYTAYNAFSELINDTKCNASQQITDHIDQLRELQEKVEHFFDYLQASQEENSEIEN